jgi:hypothetical protein
MRVGAIHPPKVGRPVACGAAPVKAAYIDQRTDMAWKEQQDSNDGTERGREERVE